MLKGHCSFNEIKLVPSSCSEHFLADKYLLQTIKMGDNKCCKMHLKEKMVISLVKTAFSI